jgi:hypothetical protein
MGRKNEHMAMSVYEKIIAEGRGHVEFIWLHLFGEPLLNPNIYAMIDIAEESGIRVGLSTNVTPLTERAPHAPFWIAACRFSSCASMELPKRPMRRFG